MNKVSSQSDEGRYRIFLVDDHPLVREWLTTLLEQQPDLKICGEAEDADTAFSEILSGQPHLVIIDLSLKSTSGIDLIKNLKVSCSEICILVLSMHEESSFAERALRAGAMGYVMKRETSKRVVTAIRTVLRGEIYLSEKLAAALAKKHVGGKESGGSAPLKILSDRELEVFQLLGKGLGTPQIADLLHISLKTVQAYCARIKEKLHLANATELLREAILWAELQNIHPPAEKP